MTEVRIYLRTTLFTVRDEPHVPPGTFIIEGLLEGRADGGLLVQARRYWDETRRPLEGEARKLFLPVAKVDHVLFLEQ